MTRDFTFVSDLVKAVRLLIDAAPALPDDRDADVPGDTLSAVAPHRVVVVVPRCDTEGHTGVLQQREDGLDDLSSPMDLMVDATWAACADACMSAFVRACIL